LDKLDIFNLATPTSTECPEEEPMMDFLEEDEKEASTSDAVIFGVHDMGLQSSGRPHWGLRFAVGN